MEGDQPDPMPSGLSASVWRHSFDVAQAFSHFTCEDSGWAEALLDLQGVGTTFTDLAVASAAHARGRAGTTDLGQDAIVNFMNNHHARTCRRNAVCIELVRRRTARFEHCSPINA